MKLCLAHLKITGWWESGIWAKGHAFLHNNTNAVIYFNPNHNAWEFLTNGETKNEFTTNIILTLNEIMSSAS